MERKCGTYLQFWLEATEGTTTVDSILCGTGAQVIPSQRPPPLPTGGSDSSPGKNLGENGPPPSVPLW